MTIDSTADTFSQQPSKIAGVINSMLASEPSVTTCLTLVSPEKNNHICAFVVSSGANLDRQFRARIDAIIAQSKKAIEVHLIAVSNLPLTADGEIDIRLLLELPIVDQTTAASCERKIKARYPDFQVLVEIIEQNFPIGLIHCTDLGMQPHQFIRTEYLANNGQPQEPTNYGDSKSTSEKAIANNVPLTISNAATTLPETLLRTASKSTNRGVGYIDKNEQWAFQSYSMLNEDAQNILAALQDQGVSAGEKVLFQLSDNSNFIPAFWACIVGGIVPVPMANSATYSDASNNAVRNLVDTWTFLGKPTILSSKRTDKHISRMFQTLGLSGIRTLAIETLRESGRGLEVALHNADPGDLAMLLFTSGSTGHPKGICYTHRNLIENVASSAKMNHVTELDVTLNWLHLDHVGALVRCCIRDVYVGNTQIHAATQLFLHDPLRWLKWIDTHRVTFAWAPNFGLSLLNDRLRASTSLNMDLSFVRSILSVAEPIVPKVAREFAANLQRFGIGPEKLHAAWGMSETCAAVVFSYDFLSQLPSPDYPFVEVGSPVPGLSIRIVDSDDRIVNEGSVGNVQITGPMVVSSYFADDEETNSAYTNDGWFRTGDLGLLKNGRLTITGRQKDTIIINGRNIANHVVEAVVDAAPGVKKAFSAAIGVREHTKKTDQLVVFFSTDPEQTYDQKLLLENIQKRIIAEIGIQPAYIFPVAQNLIPKSSVGKILRSQLRDSFLKGDFDNDIKRSDLLIENERTLPNWFLKKTWKRKQALLSESPLGEPGVTIIFQDSLGLAHSLRGRLESLGHTCLLVRPGNTFNIDNINEFVIDPGSEDHHQLLIEAVFNNHRTVQQVFHLWAYTSRPEKDTLHVRDNELDIWYLSLAFLAKAFSKHPQNEKAVTIYVCATDAQPASDDDYLCCEKSLALGLVRTIPQEQPLLDWRHLDMQGQDIEEDARLIMNELATIDHDREVAFRKGIRLIPVLEELASSEFLANSQSDIQLQSGGLYLITGGLGEIGLELAQALLEDNNAKLLLVGRSALPSTHSSSSLPNRISMDNERFVKTLNRYQILQASYPYVEYRTIDICDDRALIAAVKNLESKWQTKLCGVFHLARVTDDRLICEQTRESILNTLKPKVQGTISIGRLLEHSPAAFFVGFSSVSSTLGTYRMGPYASANRFLDNFCISLRNSKGRAARSLAWSIWEEVGTERNYQMRDLSLKKGLLSQSTEKGIASMFAAMRCQETGVIIGLNPENRFISQFMAGIPKTIDELRAKITFTESGSDCSRIDNIVIQDRLGHSVPCRLINTESLQAKRSNSAERLASSPEFTQFRAELEKKITTIWEKLLQIDCIEPEDNFFDLGGHSILAAQFAVELNSQTDGRIELNILFEHPVLKDFIASILNHRAGLNKRSDDQLPSLTQLASLAESYYETVSIAVRRRFPQALELFPIVDYIEKILVLPTLASYTQIGRTCGPVMKDLKEKAGDDLEPLYNRLAIVHAIQNTLKNIDERCFPEDIEGLFIEWFRDMLESIYRPDADYFRLDSDPFLKDMAVCVGRMIPIGGAWAVEISGLSRRITFGCGPRQLLTRTIFLLSHIRALKPLFEIHMIPRLADRFTKDEREASYLRIAKLLCANPEVRGLIGSSWYLDPALKDISPELSYLQDLPENNGARIFPLNPSKMNDGALIGSVRRTQLHKEGKYVPRNGLIVWPRKAILKWARTRVITKNED